MTVYADPGLLQSLLQSFPEDEKQRDIIGCKIMSYELAKNHSPVIVRLLAEHDPNVLKPEAP